MSRLVVAAPVYDRAWALPHWYRHLASQTVVPDEVLLVHSGSKGDATWQAIDDAAAETGILTHRIHDPAPGHNRGDDSRFLTLVRLRNKMLASASVFTDAQHLLSLDTDVMLTDPLTIERLLWSVEPTRLGLETWTPDVCSCLTHFHPDMQWTRNAGYLGNPEHHPQEALDAGRPEDLATWPWRRAEINKVYELGGIQPIDIPMAIVMMPARVYRDQRVRYRWHEAGEDIGFGVVLKLAGLVAGWIPSLEARHCWDNSKLP